MPCSVTYEFRVIRWANSGGSCARGFCARTRDEEGRKKMIVGGKETNREKKEREREEQRDGGRE